MDLIYVDNNASTRIAPEAFEAMRPFLEEEFGNASSLHQLGAKAVAAVEKARMQVANLLGAAPGEIVFTSGGTESDNAALLSALELNPDKKHIVTTTVEHPAVLSLCEHLVKRRGCRVTHVGVRGDGTLDARKVVDAIEDDTAVVSVMAANNETGVMFPVAEIAAACREGGVLFHTDAVQQAGKADLTGVRPDFLSLSAHKIHGPKGVGVLYVRRGVRFAPLIRGGAQERRRRGGTQNVAGIVGFGMAAQLAAETVARGDGRMGALRDRMESALVDACPGAVVNGAGAPRVANTSNISFDRIEAEAVLISLDRENICASSGAACSSGTSEPSHVMKAMSVPAARARGSVRFSLSRYTTEAEVERVIEVVPRIVEKLGAVAPFQRR